MRTIDWLHVEGRWIKDSTGAVVVLKGACEMSLAYGLYGVTSSDEHSNYLAAHTFDLAEEAGANMIRVGINLNTVFDQASVNAVIQVVQWCKERGMWVLLDMHGPDEQCGQGDVWLSTLLDPARFYSAWTSWAQIFRNEPTVAAYGLMNEPPPAGTGGYTYAQLESIWRQVAIETIQRIRAVTPNPLIFMDNVSWASDLNQFINNPLSLPNIVYCLHRYYYLDWNNGLSYARAYGDGDFTNGYSLMKQFYYDKGFKLLDMGYPVIMEEWGAYRADSQFPATIPPNMLRQLTDTYKLFDEWESGYLQYQLGGRVPGYSAHHTLLTDNWSALNEVGLAWKENMISTTPLPPPPTPEESTNTISPLLILGLVAAFALGG